MSRAHKHGGQPAPPPPAPGFWHRRAPVDALCLYRIGFGGLLLRDALNWLVHARELFSSDGFHLGPLMRYAPPPAIATALGVALVTSAACLTAGYLTRTAIAVTWCVDVFLYSVDHINEKAITTIAMVVLAILFFSECGARYSVDDWLARRRNLPRRPSSVCIMPQRALQIEFAQVYLFAGLAKLSNPEWVNGNVFALSFASRHGTDLGVWISGWIPLGAARAGALIVIAYELTAGFLLFVPKVRRFAIALGVIFHAGIQATLAIGSLGPQFIVALLLLFPDPETVAGRAEAVGTRFRSPRGAAGPIVQSAP